MSAESVEAATEARASLVEASEGWNEEVARCARVVERAVALVIADEIPRLVANFIEAMEVATAALAALIGAEAIAMRDAHRPAESGPLFDARRAIRHADELPADAARHPAKSKWSRFAIALAESHLAPTP